MSLNRNAVGLFAMAGAAALTVAGVAGLVISRPGPSRGQPNAQVTIYAPSPAPATPEPAAVGDAIAPTQATAAPSPAPTARAAQYVIQQNDTLWDIALRFGFASPDPIIAANPGLNPDLLAVGRALVIPGLDFIPPPQTTAQQAVNADAPAQQTLARVKADAGGLRLRREPVVGDNIVTKLSPLTPLSVLARSADNAWLQVVTPANTGGWVQAQYVENVGNSTGTSASVTLPVIEQASDIARTAPAAVELPPYLSDFSARAVEVYRFGQTRGNRPNVFALIGDSNTENPKFFRPFDWGMYNLGSYAYLQDTVSYFKGSFDRTSPAARGGFSTSKVLDPGHADPNACGGESPVVCELRLQRPSVALVLIGTGDQHSWQGFEGRYRQIIDTCLQYGVVPILITKGDDLEHRDNSAPSGYINSIIRRLAAEYQMPLLNLSQVLDTLPARGFTDDGFHYNWPPDERPADLTPDKLVYGFNQRNLTALQALDAFRRRVIGGA
jgi:LysM repeat protein